jgi:phage terminase small subunit
MKQQWIVFSDHYLKSNNATNAYKSAYPNCTNDASAWANGSRLLRNDKVAKYIEEKRNELEKKEIISREQILNDLNIIVAQNLTERPLVAIKAYDLAVKILGLQQPTTKSLQQDITTQSGDKISINLNLE